MRKSVVRARPRRETWDPGKQGRRGRGNEERGNPGRVAPGPDMRGALRSVGAGAERRQTTTVVMSRLSMGDLSRGCPKRWEVFSNSQAASISTASRVPYLQHAWCCPKRWRVGGMQTAAGAWRGAIRLAWGRAEIGQLREGRSSASRGKKGLSEKRERGDAGNQVRG